jgi:hypothetical protein
LSSTAVMERTEADALLDLWHKEGRLRIDPEFSLAALGEPDESYQSRVGIDMEHALALAGTLKREGSLSRVVIFEFPGKGKDKGRVVFKLVAGFHRREAYLRCGFAGIPAYVVKGTPAEAVRFSVLSNKRCILPTSPEDKRKSILMYFGNPTLRELSFADIAGEVGTNKATVELCWQSWCKDNGAEADRDEPSPLIRYVEKVDPDSGRKSAEMVVRGDVIPLGPAGKRARKTFERERDLVLREEAARDGMEGGRPPRSSRRRPGRAACGRWSWPAGRCSSASWRWTRGSSTRSSG